MPTMHISQRNFGLRNKVAAVALLVLLPTAVFSQDAADSGGMTWWQFRSAVEARLTEAARAASRSREKPAPPDHHAETLRLAEEAFAQLLAAQAGQAAAQQSLDRLAGWSKAIQARLEAQNAPELDLETIRFAEARMAAASARFDRQRQQAAAQANALLGRPAASPLTALVLPPPAAASNSASNPEGREGKSAGDLLAQGRELLAKMYQSYSFGGTPLAALLWQEQQVYQAEMEYRIAMVAAMAPEAVPVSVGKE